MEPSIPQRSNRRAFRVILHLALEIPSICLLLLVFGVIRSAWTAAVLIMAGVGLLIGLAIAWGLKQSRDLDDAAAEQAVEPDDPAAGTS